MKTRDVDSAKMPDPTVPPNTRNDFKIIQTWIRVARYLSFAPFGLHHDNYNPPRKNKVDLISIIYPLCMFLIYLGATIFSFIERYYIYKKFNISQIILDVLQGVTEAVFVEFVIVRSVLRRKEWMKLINSVAQLEEKVNRYLDGAVGDSTCRGLKVKIVLYHLVYVGAHLYDSIVNWKDASYSLAFVIFRVTTYYIMFSTLLVAFFCTWLKHRYIFLGHFLKYSIIRSKFKFMAFDKEPTVFYRDKLKEFSQIYKGLYMIVQDFNEIFGYQLFFISISTVMEILNAFNYGMPTSQKAVITDSTFVNTIYSTLYLICITRIVMSCDSVEKCGRKIWETCLILHENTEKYELKEDLYRLENYVKGLRPKFSAAGFWEVNQGYMATLFSSVMTYLIIIIQFNITLPH